AALDLDTADHQVVTEALRLTTRLIRMTQAVELEADLRLVALAEADPTINPEHLDAAATGRSPSKATAAIRRATAAQTLPHLRALLAAGSVGVEHLDAFTTALRSLRTGLRPRLLAQESQLAGFAAHMTAEEFRARLDAVVRDIEGDDGADRLQRQRRHIGARTWTGRDGMWNIHGRYDAERAVSLIEALRRATEARFHGEHPAETPDDPRPPTIRCCATSSSRRSASPISCSARPVAADGPSSSSPSTRRRCATVDTPAAASTAAGASTSPSRRCRRSPAERGSSRS
ncbi:MAG: hypothetical protein NTZ21_13890, partial [Actinobacteria bacterium]|nr:hypothetical protein [Actinomycetota bacterium]